VRALSVIHYPFFGGPANQVLRLASPLRELGWENLAVLPDDPGPAVGRLSEAGVETLVMRLGRLRAVRSPAVQLQTAAGLRSDVQRLRGLLRRRPVDVVLIHGILNPQAAIAARLEAVPVVWQILDTRTPAPITRAVMPFVRATGDALMSTGVEVARQHGVDPHDDRLVPYFPPVDTARCAPSSARRRAARERLGLGDEEVVVGTLGNLTPQKGHEHLIAAAARLRVRHPSLKYRILGAPFETHRAYEGELRRAVESSDLTSVFQIIDPGAGAVDLLPALDLFVLSSVRRSEGIPTAMLEAMASGVPVVASAVGSVPETLDGSDAGVLVEPEETDALAAAVESMVVDESRRARMADAARIFAVEQFDAHVCAETHVRAFEMAVSRSAGR